MTDNTVKSMSLLTVDGLVHRFGDREVVNVGAWSLAKGQHQVLQGPSGSGKTTFLSILTGLLRPTEGTVSLGDQRIDNARPTAADLMRAQNYGIVFQDNHLIASLSLEANMKLSQKLAGGSIDNEWTEHLLDQMGLIELKANKPAALSRGEAQRAAIVRAAVTRPPILIADEPTSALDDQNTARVLALLQSLAEEAGSTLLIATHDHRVASVFDRRLEFAGPMGAVA